MDVSAALQSPKRRDSAARHRQPTPPKSTRIISPSPTPFADYTRIKQIGDRGQASRVAHCSRRFATESSPCSLRAY